MNWYLEVLKKYVVFEGRARRSEYWFFTLFNAIAYIVLAVLDMAMGLGFLALIYSLAVLLPSLGVAVRRLHDTNRSGWWVLIPLIPLIGVIIFIVFAVQEGTPGQNQYGPNPKEATA